MLYACADHSKGIARFGAGFETVDLEKATELGIAVCNAPGVNAKAVAEQALALTLAILRKITIYDRSLRADGVTAKMSQTLEGTVALLGFGNIGCEFAKLLSVFPVKVISYDPYPNYEKAAELGMDSTHFVTCTGLHDENHYTTVRDLTKLLSYALQNDTFRQIYCTSEYTTSATASAPEGLHFLSTMFKKMDSPEVNGGEIEGGKTGYTGEAGQCLASLAKVDDVEYILVTAGAPGGPSTEPYHIEDAKAVYNRIQAGEQGSTADTAADSQDDQTTTETDGAA